MREKQQKLLKLPGVGSDGAMHPKVLELIIELTYKRVLENAPNRLDAALALHLLATADLYLLPHGDEQMKGGDASVGLLSQLVDVANAQVQFGLTVDCCVEVFKVATEMKRTDVAARAKAMIVANKSKILADPAKKAALMAFAAARSNDAPLGVYLLTLYL